MVGTVLKNVFLVLDSILVDRLTMLAMTDLRKRFFRRTLRLDLSHFGDSKTSELTARFTTTWMPCTLGFKPCSVGQSVSL